MDLRVPISNEAEFQKWLAEVLQAERNRLRNDAAIDQISNSSSFEVVSNSGNEGDRA
jgi:hypothetical protein